MIKIYYFSLVVVALSMVAYTIVTSSQFVSTGRQIAQLEKTKVSLQAQQQSLENQIAQENSTAQISSFAQSQGYVPMNQLVAAHAPSERVAMR